MPARLTGKGVKTFKELTVWNKAVDFAVLIYETSHSFPKSEQYGIVSHIQKTVVSIPSNIAEGFGRNTRPDFVRFLRIALASLYERQTQLEIASKLMYIDSTSYKKTEQYWDEVGKMLNSLIKKLGQDQRPGQRRRIRSFCWL